ncbi:hypothetical protein [Mycobacterium malmoense]|uniref:hypothetical protein n=1 Tax=Mycobacterium malmoense TaxID=1780 RepID=UPI001586596D|nr:hypothetical protein [Mycobacterium malmoense]
MADIREWGPQDYEDHRKALGYLNARTVAPDTADAYMHPILEEAEDLRDEMTRLFSAMGSIAQYLAQLRAKEMGIPAAETFAQLGRIISPPGE